MHPAEYSILLHRALEARIGRLLELTASEEWRLDPELLHDVRVASRRIRAVLELVDPIIYPKFNRHLRQLKALTRILGTAREQDVHLQILTALASPNLDTTTLAALEHTQEILDRSRRKAQRRVARDLTGLRISDCAGLLKVPSLPDPFAPGEVRASAWTCLEPWLQAALGQLPEVALVEDAVAMHELRIRVKKCRYTLEILSPAVDGDTTTALSRLRELQTALGAHHDLSTLEAFLWAHHARLTERHRSVLASGLLEIVGRVAEDRRTCFDRFRLLALALPLEAFKAILRPAAPGQEVVL